MDSVEAFLWLLAGARTSHALFMVHHAAEVAFKGLLEEINVLLTLDALEYGLAKGLAKDDVLRHRLGAGVAGFKDPADYDPTRTCRFEEAYRRVKELVHFEAVSRSEVESLNRVRNSIVHYGARPDSEFDYASTILCIALPLLEEFYRIAYEVDLADFVFGGNYRELSIARQYAKEAGENSDLPRTRILRPFQCSYFQDAVIGIGNAAFDPEGWRRPRVDEWHDELKQEARRAAEKRGWEILGDGAPTECVACGADGCVVAVDDAIGDPPEEYYEAAALHCVECGLFLDTSHRRLAALHYGPITQARLGEEAWDAEVPR